MTGPSLKQLQAHKQIHDTGLALAVQMTDDLIMNYKDYDEATLKQEVLELSSTSLNHASSVMQTLKKKRRDFIVKSLQRTLKRLTL